MKLQELLTAIMDMAKKLLKSEGSSLLLFDPQSGDLIFNVVIGNKGDIITGERVPKGKGIAGTVAETGTPIIVDDAQNDPRFFKEIDKKTQFLTKNILCLPMTVMGDLVGVLEVVNSIGRESFDGWDLKKAQYLADLAAIAIHNRKMYDDLARRVDELSALYEVSQVISLANLNDENIFYHIIETLSKILGVRKSSIFMYDKKLDNLKLVASFGLPEEIGKGFTVEVEQSIAGLVFKTKEPIIVSDIGKQLPMGLHSDNRNYSTTSFISIPIMYKNDIFGVLNMADKISDRSFDTFDLQVLSTVSNQIADTFKSIENHQEILVQKRLAQEIDIAAEIQRKILPDIPAQFKNHKLLAFNNPAKVVGGDFYDYFKFDDNKYAVLIADVSGKGIPAAMFMGSAKYIVRAETRISYSPAPLLKEANKLIFDNSEHGMFVTLFYAVIDSHNNIITFGSAGHINQLLLKKRTKEVIKLNASGTALGIMHNIEFEEKIAFYEQGDMLLLFTDGVIECLGGENLDVTIGEDELARLAFPFIDSEPNELLQHLVNEFDENPLVTKYRDDFTIIIIKF